MISIVIPAFNEAEAIQSTIQGVQEALGKAGLEPFEIIVVDDASDDGTGAIAKEAGAEVISHPLNAGYGRSLKDGILAAKFDTIIITDADGTYPLSEIPTLFAEYDKGLDMVVGARQGTAYRETFLKSPLRLFLKFLVEFSCGSRVPDVNSGLRIFCRSTVIPYFRHLANGFSFTTSQTLSYLMTGRFVRYVPISYYPRIGKSKVRLLRDSLRTLQYIVESITYYNPLKIFLLMSFILIIAATIGFIAAYATQIFAFYYLSLGSSLLAVLVFALGLMAVLLKQTVVGSEQRQDPKGDRPPAVD